MKHIFGPVQSRRLGRSLGIDLFSEKNCNLDCIYCEVGKRGSAGGSPAVLPPAAGIIREIEAFFAVPKHDETIDAVTVTAKGEPTLHEEIGRIGSRLRQLTGKPVAVLTNGTTLGLPQVRQALSFADIVIPSLDSALPHGFRKINRPAAGLDVKKIIAGQRDFVRSFAGAVWLEILLVKDLNDSEEELAALARAIRWIRPDRVQLNTVARPPLEDFARPLSLKEMAAAAAFFRKESGPHIPVDAITENDPTVCRDDWSKADESEQATHAALLEKIVGVLARRPCTAEDINRMFPLGGAQQVDQLLVPLVTQKRIVQRIHRGAVYYQA